MFAMMMRNPAQMMFLFTTLALGYLVLPPFFFILHTSLVVDRGLQAGSFTIQHFTNIIESLGDVKTLLWNSMVFSVGSAGLALCYGTALAWLAERCGEPRTPPSLFNEAFPKLADAPGTYVLER